MAVFNYLLLSITCPRCGIQVEVEAEFRFGLRDLAHYRIGDKLHWDGMGVKTPESRPDKGNYDDEAYVVCPHCERDCWLTVSIRNDIIVSATVDTTKQPYISDD
jgi:anaerobic selenocysteine-containing dehydrogenase